jgi:hypothetical protein
MFQPIWPSSSVSKKIIVALDATAANIGEELYIQILAFIYLQFSKMKFGSTTMSPEFLCICTY